ncbi:MAG: hypothetical protein JST70_18910 [Bacteroidetes bacterium]|nr:hypothetical protein [Bacteroidota bacterium]
MKKIVLASALAFASFAANAQSFPSNPSTNPSTVDRQEDAANLTIMMHLHDWIDIDNENNLLISTQPDAWSDLNNGWNVGYGIFNLSASRKCKVAIKSTDVREALHPTAGAGSGWYFPASYLSLEQSSSVAGNISQTVTGSGFSDSWNQIDHLTGANQTCYTSNQGMYLRRLQPMIGAFKHDGAGAYYTQNLNGGTYYGTVTFTATLQ